MLYTDEHVFDLADTDKLVELDLNGCVVAVLRTLDQKNHQKSDNCRSRVDDELPRVRVMEDWSGRRPNTMTQVARTKAEGRPARRAIAFANAPNSLEIGLALPPCVFTAQLQNEKANCIIASSTSSPVDPDQSGGWLRH